MLAKISGALTCALLVAGLSQPTFARGKTNAPNTATVTGCLTQGDEPNEYAVKSTEDGKTYGLKSSKVDFGSAPEPQSNRDGRSHSGKREDQGFEIR
jgi:hypothetical protein